MTEEEKMTCEHNRKKGFMKYIGVLLATLLGAFLAFYFVADMTIKHMMDPMYQFRKMDKMMQHQEREMENFDKKMMKDMRIKMPMHQKSIVEIQKLDDEYKIIVDLRPFDNNEKNVRVEVRDNMATVNASVEKEKRHEDSIVEFSQTFYLEGDLDTSKIKKERFKDKYIVTVPERD